MKMENLTDSQIEKARACRTMAERLDFLRDNHIELTPEQMELVGGGVADRPGQHADRSECSSSPDGFHKWVFTGQTRPGTAWGDLWPDYNHVCTHCGKQEWKWFIQS